METEKIQMWIDALRSGDYQQARFALRADVIDDDLIPKVAGYCCLGVLCEVAIKDGVDIHPSPAGYKDSDHGFEYSGALPQAVLKWMDALDSPLQESGDFRVYVDADNRDYLASLNDSGNFTFADIADIIENNLKGAK